MPTPARKTKTISPGSRSPTSATGDDDRARDLLLWCRGQNIHVHRIRIGDVELEGIADMSRLQAPDDQPDRTSTDLRAQYGGDALARLHRERASQHAVDDVTLGAPPADPSE